MAKAEPLSIEFLLEKQRADKEAASKPRFLTKEERAKLAIQKREQDIKEKVEKEEARRRERESLEKEAEALRALERARDEESRYGRGGRYDDRYHDRDRDRYGRRDHRGGRRDDRDRDRDRGPPPSSGMQNVPTAPRADRAKGASASQSGTSTPSASMPPPPAVNGSSALVDTSSNFVPQMNDNDLNAIRSRYLGVDKKKRKIRKMSDRKFVFDWDEQDDTLAEDSPLVVGANRQGAQVMFGRGHIAGMDDGATASRELHGAEGRFSDSLERRKATKAGVDERHWSEKSLSEMKERDWRIFREDFSIAARGGMIPHPLRSWAESEIPPTILEVLEKVGYKEPSPIQRQAIPIGLQNRDLIGIAETGSGKTAAFVIPMLTYISHLPPLGEDNKHLGPFALILAPTRELAQQIETETRKFATPLGFKCVSIVGGRSVEEQSFNLRDGAEIIIATPGRLKDIIERRVIVLSQCSYIVMDEADRMVNLGFEVDLMFILDQLPSETLKGEDEGMMDVDGEMVRRGRTRVTTLFSATMPPPVERLTRKYLRKPAIVTIGEAGRAVDTVDQRVEFVNGDEKKRLRMLEILGSGAFPAPIIVFVNQKKTADMVCKDVQKGGFRATTLHSGKNQEQREAALQALRSGESEVLVATDLAGRGIDVQDVSLVLNYQMANTIEGYVHRIGRTGRAGKLGTAITFLTNDDDEVMYDLRQEIAKSPVSKVPPELAKHEAAQTRVSREMKRKRDGEDQG